MVDEAMEQFDDPGTATKIKWDELNGRLLLVYPHSLEKDVETEYGAKDAIRADVIVLDGPNAPEEIMDCLVFPGGLQGQIRNNIGKGRPNLGRLSQEPSGKGNPKWVLSAVGAKEKAIASAYISKRPVADDPGTDVPF